MLRLGKLPGDRTKVKTQATRFPSGTNPHEAAFIPAAHCAPHVALAGAHETMPHVLLMSIPPTLPVARTLDSPLAGTMLALQLRPICLFSLMVT